MLIQRKYPRTSNIKMFFFWPSSWRMIFFGKFMISDTSLRYNAGLDNFVHMRTGPSKPMFAYQQLHVCTYYVLVDKAQVSCCACGDTVSHKTAMKNHMQVCRIDLKHMQMQAHKSGLTFTKALEI